jgi:hypothetical protein
MSFISQSSPNVSAENLKFLAWQQRGGHLHRQHSPESVINTFTQADLDGGKIHFKIAENKGDKITV